ncbi:MAG: HupE/UreJ family protein [Gemmatimonadota bacterium]
MRFRPARHSFFLVIAGVLTLTLGTAAPANAHEIPGTVAVLAYVKPEGRALHVVMRVPLEAMRDIDIPLSPQGFLDIRAVQPLLPEAATQWIADYLKVYENGRLLKGTRLAGVRISLPSDRSFVEYRTASLHFRDPPNDAVTDLPWRQAMLDVAFDYPIESEQSAFSIDPSLAHLGVHTNTVLRFLPPDRPERAFAYSGNPGLVALDPRWHQAARRFVQLGFTHILSGIDHLLFLLCLVIPLRRLRPLIVVATSFTLAHSITLAISALGFAPDALWFPPLIEVLVALSIVYMAIENIVGARLDRRWLVAFAFGLVHGFAFSFALRESMQFGGAHVAASLLAFNVGVELAQLLVVAVALPLLSLLFRRVVDERMGTIILSALVAHTTWHWMLDRGATLGQYRFEWPPLDAALAVTAMRGAMVLIILAGALWLLAALGDRLAPAATEREVGVE